MPLVEFELAIPASERQQTQALDRAAAGISTTTVSNGKLHTELHVLNSLNHKDRLEFLDFVFILTRQKVMGRHAWFAVELDGN
jgi:hypothetical protein